MNPFTLLAPVARESECDSQLIRAFPHFLRFKPYSDDEMSQITQGIASGFGISLDPATVTMIASASKGNAKEAEHIVTRLLNTGGKAPTQDEARDLLGLYGIQERPAGSSAVGQNFTELSPVEFEHLIARLLRDMGFGAETTKASGDGGIDVEAVLRRPIVGGRYLFQCKRFAPDNPVGSAALREFMGR